MQIRFYVDPETNLPHIYNHQVQEQEVAEIVHNPGRGSPGLKITLE